MANINQLSGFLCRRTSVVYTIRLNDQNRWLLVGTSQFQV